jgi:hypothetical protein
MNPFGSRPIFRLVCSSVWMMHCLTMFSHAAEERFINGFYEGAALVQAKAIKVAPRDEQGNVPLTMQIEHVYCGPPELKEKTFWGSAQQFPTGGSVGNERLFHFDPLPREGETGIWWVASQAPKSWEAFRAVKNPCFATKLPCRKGIGPRFDEALEWAQAVERVSSAPRDQQLNLLRGFARSTNYETSFWAITVLNKEWGQKAERVLEELVSHEKLTPAAITALDAALQEIQGDDWRKSVGRWELLERSLRSVETDVEAKLIMDYWTTLGRVPNRHDHSTERCLEIVRRAFSDPNCPDRIRNKLFMAVLRFPFLTSDDDEAIWAFAIENISQPVSSAIAGNAAFMLMDTRCRTPRRFRTLLNLYRDEKHPQVAGQLGNVLAKWHEDAAKFKATP